MKKKFAAFLLAVLLLVGVFPLTALADNPHRTEVFNEPVQLMGYRVRINTSTAYTASEVQGGTISNNKNTMYLRTQGSWTFTATPKTGYRFDGWTYSGPSGAFSVSGSNSEVLTISFINNSNYTATANFHEVQTFNLTTGVNPSGSGSISKNPNQTSFTEGTNVTLTAVPEPGQQFSYWSGDASGSTNPLTVTMNGNKSITAVFSPLPTYTLSTTVSPAGTGSVIKNPDVAAYWQGRSVTLTANAASGYRFGSWSDGASGTSNPVTVTVDTNKTVTANFIKTYYVTLNTEGQGHFDNENAVEGTHDTDSVINLSDADPDTDVLSTWMFLGWRDNATGEFLDSPVITLTSDRSFTAVFRERNRLSLDAASNGYLANPGLAGHYAEGTEVNLNDASPTGNAGYTLDCWKEYGWMWAGSGTAVTLKNGQPIITIGESNYFKAHFKIADYTITYNLGGGAVSPANPSSYTYFTNSFTLNNPTKTGYTFRGWSGTGIPDGTYPTNVTVSKNSSGNRTYTANWTPVNYTIGYTLNGGTADPANRTSYTIEDSFTLTNPTKAGYDFIGWTGTGLSEKTMTVRIPSGSTGGREYTANWRVAGISVTGYNGDYDAAAHSVTVAGSLPTDTVMYSLDGNNYSASNPGFTNVTSSEGVKVYVKVERPGAAAYEGSAVIKITKAALTINAKDASIKYGDPKPAFDVDIAGYYGDVNAVKALITYTCDYAAGDNAATYAIVPDGFTSGNYDIHYAAGTLTVEKADADISVNGVTFTYNTLSHGASGSATGVDGTDLSSLLDLGETYINAPGGTAHWSFAGNENYNAASGSVEIVINKAVLNVRADDLTIEYGDDVPAYTYKVGIHTPDFWDGIVIGAPVLDCDYDKGDNAGDYGITVDVSSMTAVNYSFAAADGTLKVDKKLLDIFGENVAITYGEALPEFKVSYGPFVNGDDESDLTGTLSFNCTYTAGEPVKQYGFMPQGLDSNNYSIVYHAGLLTVNKAPLKVTADGKTVTFLDPAPVYTASYSGFVAGDDVSDLSGVLALNCSYAAGNAVGTYTITPSGYTSDNYDISFVPGTLTVNTLYLDVEFVDYNGDTLGTDTVAYGTAADAPANPARTGYRFTGWDKPFNNVTSDITVTALYTINRYTVTFNDYDGTLINTQRVNWNNGASAPDDPEREGYTFTGWDTAFDPVTKNVDVTATYRINTYTVTFADYDGTIIDTQTVNWNTAAAAPADPSREGYVFNGWDVTFAAITADTTITAQYSQIVTADNEGVPETVTGDDEEIPLAGGAEFAWWWILIGVGAAALLLFLILVVWKRRRPEEEQQ